MAPLPRVERDQFEFEVLNEIKTLIKKILLKLQKTNVFEPSIHLQVELRDADSAVHNQHLPFQSVRTCASVLTLLGQHPHHQWKLIYKPVGRAALGDCFQMLWFQILPGPETFSLSLCGPISFLGLQHFNFSHIKYIYDLEVPRPG